MVRRSAAGALAALAEIVAPLDDTTDTDPETPTTTPTTDFATTLITHIHNLDPTITTTGRGHLTPHHALPTHAATTLTAATLEAVRNSLRHADGGTGHPVRRTVTLTTTDTTITITITDDGTGFDPTTAPTGRYGLTGSILGRLNTLDGGHAHLDTTPGHGTTITLTYTPPTPASATARHLQRPTGLLAEFRPREVGINPAIAWARRVVATAGEDIDSRLHGVFMVLVVLCMIGLAILGNDVVGNTWVNVATVAAPFLVAGSNLLLLRRDPALGLPVGGALFTAVGGAAVIAVCIPTYSGHPEPLYVLWTVVSCHIAVIFLATEGYVVCGLLCAVLGSLTLAIWGVAADMPSGVWHGTWPLLLVFWALATIFHVASVQAIGRSAEISSAHRTEIDAEARSAAAGNARRLNARRVDHLARPLLERLAAGERTLPTVRTEAQLLEARLRDDLRARCFRTTDVTRAAHDARARGIHVELLDDGALDPATSHLDPTTLHALRDHIVTTAVHTLDTADDGAVIIRVAPPGRDLTATIVTRPHTTPPTRHEIPTPVAADDAAAHGSHPVSAEAVRP